jgi:RNA polymerase sporulation-specific sigma factor
MGDPWRLQPDWAYGYFGWGRLPRPLGTDQEAQVLHCLGTELDGEARRVLIERNMRLVVYIVRKYRVRRTAYEDLLSIGTVGLVKAVRSFNPGKSAKLATYASRCIENEILMYLRHCNRWLLEVSIDEPLDEGAGDDGLTLADLLGTDGDEVGRGMEEEAERETLVQALGRLPALERLVMEMRYGLGRSHRREMTQQEVAARLGMSQSRISRMEKKIMERLRREMLAVW